MRSVKKKIIFPFQFSHFSNVHGDCGRRGVCNMEINKQSLTPLHSYSKSVL